MPSSTRPDPPFGGSIGPAWTEGSTGADPDAPLPASRYESSGELGRGGMGVVEVAVDAWLDREVARKRPHPAIGDENRDHLVREARITARLDHPGIVPILDFGVDEQGPYYTMPVLDGTTLTRALTDADRTLPSLIRVVEAVARAVAFAHARGVVHRDLKPDNILVGSFGEVRVLDWGVALDPDAPDAQVVGTAGFQAPELLEGRFVGPPADVYALGCVLREVVRDRAAPPDLLAVVERASSPTVELRYPDAGALADDLQRWLEGRRVEVHAYSAGELLRQFVHVWRVPLLLTGAGMLLTVGLLAAWNRTIGAERDRALAAERASASAKRSADANLAAALLQGASAYLLADARPQAEVLAARSLELVDTPEGRGVLMAWSGIERPRRTAATPFDCQRVFPSRDRVLCVEPDRIVARRGNEELWTVPHPQAEVRTAYFDGHLAVLLDHRTGLEVWRDGALLKRHPLLDTTLELVAGGPYLRDPTRVGRIDDQGAVIWSTPLCDRIEAAWSDGVRIAAVCSPDRLVLGDFEGPRSQWALGHPGSAVVRDAEDRIVVGTFDGFLLTDAADFLAEPSGVGSVQALVTAGTGVLVGGETLTPHFWNPGTGIFGARLPRSGRLGSEGTLVQADLIEHWVDEDSAVSRISRGGSGGLPFLDLSADGAALLSGNASGDVTVWDARSGQPSTLAKGCGNVAKTGVFSDDVVMVTQLSCPDPILQVDWRTHTPSQVLAPTPGRFSERWGDRIVVGNHGDRIIVTGAGAGVLATFDGFVAGGADDEAFWLVDREGGLSVIHADLTLERRFEVPGADDVQPWREGLLVSAGTEVSFRDAQSGEVRWTWSSPRPLTALETTPNWAAVGDLDGRLWILDGQGVLRSSARGHRRRISGLRAHGDVLWSSSWDGTARRWGLGAVDEPLATLIADVTTWDLSVEAVLQEPTP